jgi:hypothetical protein
MHENDFEKNVSEKMDQLGFDPSDAVWAGIDREINKGRRRRIPVFWLFFFGLALVGAGYYFTANKNISIALPVARQQNGIIEKQNKQSKSGIETDNQESNKTNEIEQKSSSFDKMESHVNARNGENLGENQVFKAGEGKIPEQNTDASLSNKEKTETSGQTAVDAEPGKIENEVIDSSGGKKTSVITENTFKQDSVTEVKTAKNQKKKEKSHPWKIGFSGTAGISNVSQALFQSAYSSPVTYGSNGSVNPPGPASTNATSDMSTGFSFGAGVFVNKNLSERISFSAGLDYHYYSTNIHTGSLVDSPKVLYTASAQPTSVNSFYRNGGNNSYTNQYHFIELPLSVNFQVNKSKKTPVIWEVGLSLAWMVSSNSLRYDPYSNVYFNDNQLLSKTQLNMATAIMIGFHMHKNELQIGPQLQYGLTGLMKTNSGDPGHLVYGGLKILFIPGKK